MSAQGAPPLERENSELPARQRDRSKLGIEAFLLHQAAAFVLSYLARKILMGQDKTVAGLPEELRVSFARFLPGAVLKLLSDRPG